MMNQSPEYIPPKNNELAREVVKGSLVGGAFIFAVIYGAEMIDNLTPAGSLRFLGAAAATGILSKLL